MPCGVVPCRAVRCCAVLWRAVPCFAVRCFSYIPDDNVINSKLAELARASMSSSILYSRLSLLSRFCFLGLFFNAVPVYSNSESTYECVVREHQNPSTAQHSATQHSTAQRNHPRTKQAKCVPTRICIKRSMYVHACGVRVVCLEHGAHPCTRQHAKYVPTRICIKRSMYVHACGVRVVCLEHGALAFASCLFAPKKLGHLRHQSFQSILCERA